MTDNLFYIFRRKAKIFAISIIQNGIDRQIIQAAEKQVAHKENHVIIKAPHISLLNRRIILVDNNRRNPIMFIQHLREPLQRHHYIGRSSRNSLIIKAKIAMKIERQKPANPQ